ncbi:hypothetical protein [Agrobacterium sp. NPDC090273]|uniref:hypothetical protein n=1 Tax=Agrobacterium sp. NPDC090273 TaxID=3363919 RepID=UPI00383A7742
MSSNDCQIPSEALHICWEFARGDRDVKSFEGWLYSAAEAEPALGPDRFLEAISINFADAKQVAEFRHSLTETLPAPGACKCHTFSSPKCVSLGGISLGTFEHVEDGVGHMFWLHHFHCKACGTDWWLANEQRIFDVWMLFRGKNNQPSVSTYRELLSLAIQMGGSVRYVQPENSLEIPFTIEDLATEQPGIPLSEIAKLLPIPFDVVRRHALQVVTDKGVRIDLEN